MYTRCFFYSVFLEWKLTRDAILHRRIAVGDRAIDGPRILFASQRKNIGDAADLDPI